MSRFLGAMIVVVLAVVALVAAETAWGCSCAQQSAQEKYDGADAAFIGTVESRRDAGDGAPYGPGGRVIYTYVVEESFKRDLGRRIEVSTTTADSMCGYDAPVGERHSMVLHDEARTSDGAWGSGICNGIDPEQLRAAAKGSGTKPQPPGPGPEPPQPEPQPEPQPTPPAGGLVVAGRFGTARVLLLDGAGKTIARGAGAGRTIDVALCGGRLAELAIVGGRTRLIVRKLPSLGVVSNRAARREHDVVGCVRGRAVGRAFSGEDKPLLPVALGKTKYSVRGTALVRGDEAIRRFERSPAALLAVPALARASALCAG